MGLLQNCLLHITGVGNSCEILCKLYAVWELWRMNINILLGYIADSSVDAMHMHINKLIPFNIPFCRILAPHVKAKVQQFVALAPLGNHNPVACLQWMGRLWCCFT